MAKRGRKKTGRYRSISFRLWLTAEEKARIKALAKASDLKFHPYARARLLGESIKASPGRSGKGPESRPPRPEPQ